MKSFLSIPVLFFCLAGLPISLFYGEPLFAAETESSAHKTKKAKAMNQKVYEKLTDAQELIEQKLYAQGLAVLDKIRDIKKLTDYENAQLWNYYAYTYYLQERYKESIDAYEKVLAQAELPEGLMTSTLNTLSQLYFATENYHKALDTAQWLVSMVAEPSPNIYLLIGQAHYQLNNYKEAIVPISKAIDIHRRNGKEPEENWLLLLRAIYYEMNNYEKMVAVLNELLRLYSKEEYLRTLAGVYSELEQPKKQLAIMEALYDRGYMKKSNEKLNLANMFLLHGVPFKAARLLQKLTDNKDITINETNLRLLSQAWQQARDDKKAIPPLERAAALSSGGDLYVRLAQAYINLEKWQEAIGALNDALDKGNLKRPDAAHIMLGMAYFNQKSLELAKDAFIKASKDKRSHKTANQWITYVENEQERVKAIASLVN